MLWKYNSKGTKIPIRIGGEAGSSTDSSCWCSFEMAVEASQYYQGIATVITDPYTGIDLDNCFTADGSFRDWALPIVARLDGVAYAEISPSGTGIKFLTRARKTPGSKCLCKFAEGPGKQQMEVYDSKRFWTITGNVYNGQEEIGDGQHVIDWICDTYLKSDQAEQKGTVKHDAAPPRMLPSSLMDRAKAYVEKVPGEKKGNLRNAAFKLSGHLHSLVDEFGNRLTDPEVHDLLRDWNQKNTPPLRDEELQEASINGRKNGTPRADKVPGLIDLPVAQTFADVDISGILNQVRDEKPFPLDCLEAPGLLGDLVKYNLATAHYPLPELALAGALALLSTVTGGKVAGLRARSNVYVIGLALSGGGKDHARKLNRQILMQCGAGELCGPERIGSHAGIVSALAENWLTLFQIDEINSLLATMKGSATTAPHLYNVASVLQQIYSSSDSCWQADAYGDRKKVKRLEYPHCVLYGTGIPDSFWKAISRENLTTGLVGRFLIFEHGTYADYQDPADLEIPEQITRRVQQWLDLQTHGGNLHGHGGGHPKKMDVSLEAAVRLREHAIEISQKRKTEDPVRAAIWSRHAEKTNKLALLFACSRGCDPWETITIDDADRAVRLNNYLTRRMLVRAGLWIAENQTEADTLRMLRTIQERPEWTQSELTRVTYWCKRRERQELLLSLLESGQVVIEERDGGKGRTVSFVKATK